MLRIWIRIIFQDPDPFPGCLGSGSVSYSNGKTKLTGRENLPKNTFCVGPVGPNDKENQVKMYKKIKSTEAGSGSVSKCSGSATNMRMKHTYVKVE